MQSLTALATSDGGGGSGAGGVTLGFGGGDIAPDVDNVTDFFTASGFPCAGVSDLPVFPI